MVENETCVLHRKYVRDRKLDSRKYLYGIESASFRQNDIVYYTRSCFHVLKLQSSSETRRFVDVGVKALMISLM